MFAVIDLSLPRKTVTSVKDVLLNGRVKSLTHDKEFKQTVRDIINCAVSVGVVVNAVAIVFLLYINFMMNPFSVITFGVGGGITAIPLLAPIVLAPIGI